MIRLFLSLAIVVLLMASGVPSAGQPMAEIPEANRNAAIIYWDISIPIKGYLELKSSRLMRFLLGQNFLHTLSKYDFTTTYLVKFGKHFFDPIPVKDFKGMLNLMYYVGLETRLSDVFSQRALGQYPLRILVTDGVQSSTKGHTGSNVYEVVNAAKQVLKGEVSFWLIGLLTEYKGRRFSEKEGKYLDQPFKEKAPFYFWVIALDKELGSKIVTDLVTELKSLEPENADKEVKLIKLYPLELPDLRNVEFPLDLKNIDKKAKEAGVLPYTAKQTKDGWLQEMKCKRKDGRLEVSFTKSLSLATQPGGLSDKWAFKDLQPTENKTWVLVKDSSIAIDCAALPGKILRRVEDDVTIFGRIVPDEASAWWHEWSTDDDWKRPEGTLNLSKFVTGVAKEQLENQEWTKVLTLKIVK